MIKLGQIKFDKRRKMCETAAVVPEFPVLEACPTVTWLQLNWQLLRATGEQHYAGGKHIPVTRREYVLMERPLV